MDGCIYCVGSINIKQKTVSIVLTRVLNNAKPRSTVVSSHGQSLTTVLYLK